jgi:N-methylhydantoinase A
LRPDFFLGGKMNLELAAAIAALKPLADALQLSLEDTAHGILRIANEHMARALRVISIQRGYDVKGFRLCCFGGAGGLHVCALADALGMDKALVPLHGGVLSAFGMLVAPKERQLSQALPGMLEQTGAPAINTVLETLEQQGIRELQAESPGCSPTLQPSLDLRYRGQRYTLNIPWRNDIPSASADFHSAHAQRFGHALPMAVELVNVRLQARLQAAPLTLPKLAAREPAHPRYWVDLPGVGNQVPVFWRDELAPEQTFTGPALVAETVSTTLIESGWTCQVQPQGHLLLDRTG